MRHSESQQPRKLLSARIALAILALLVASACCLKFLSTPILWMGAIWSAALLVGAWRTRGTTKAVFFNLAALVLIVCGVEAYFAWKRPPRPSYSEPYYVTDEALGFAPARNVKARAREFHHGRLIYDVTYSVGQHGLRVGPVRADGSSSKPVLFFGCSFTYGEGLPDEKTMPYQVGLLFPEFQIRNFSFHGYGPHQMLANIQSGRVRQAVQGKPRFAIYQALPDHIARAAGKIYYGRHAPKFELNGENTLELRGHFDDAETPPSAVAGRFEAQLRKSALYTTLRNLQPATTPSDLRLFFALVEKSRDLLLADYPGLAFHVILWRNFDSEEQVYRQMQAGLQRMTFTVHCIEDILPDYNVRPEAYWLDDADRHPNARANQLIAEYVATRIITAAANSR